MNRRAFLRTAIAFVAAPAIVRASSLMPVKPVPVHYGNMEDWGDVYISDSPEDPIDLSPGLTEEQRQLLRDVRDLSLLKIYLALESVAADRGYVFRVRSVHRGHLRRGAK
jgi:hypothetical protein